MRLIPVLDLQGGTVVRGIGGRRVEYRPVSSRLTTSTSPVEVARALIAAFQPRELYLADLDAIAGRQPSWPLLANSDLNVDLWIDAGIRTIGDILELVKSQIAGIVIGLETAVGPEVLDAVISDIGRHRTVFSLDMRGGRLLGQWWSWNAREEWDWPVIVAQAVRSGVKRLVLLDLEKVGEGLGTGTEEMCRKIAREHPDLEIICGGGVRDLADLCRLQDCGASGALVASALHDGRIKPGDWPPAV